MKSNERFLSPKEVERLQSKGIYFRESADVWAKFVSKIMANKPKLTDWERAPRTDMHFCYKYGTPMHIPAPTLQEVLERLPEMTFVNGNPVWLNIYRIADMWSFGYRYIHKPGGKLFKDKNPLLASTKLLEWVRDNHHTINTTKAPFKHY